MKKGIIKIDLSDVIEEFAMAPEQIEGLSKQVLRVVTNTVAEEWRKAAGRVLKSTRASFVRSIIVVEEGKLKNAIVLKGDFNNKLESGSAAFDMKPFFQKSAKAKMSKKGNWYLRIPFRFATPGALGENSAFSGTLPKEVYKAAQQNEAQQTSLGGGKLSAPGLSKDQIPVQYRDVITKKDRDGFSDYTHKHSIYEGVFKSTKEYEKTSSGQYNSIRTAGQLSDSAAWIHPGLKAGNFSRKALDAVDVDTLVNNEVDKFLKANKL